MNNEQGFAYAPFIVIVIVLGLFAGGMMWYTNTVEIESQQGRCAEDAKQCPDGSFVGRVGSDCEFAQCPTTDDADGEIDFDDGLFETSGTVSGRVTIGPLCPVEPCDLPTGEIYSSRMLLFEPLGAGGSIDLPFEAPLNADGSYETELPEGNYSVSISECDFLGCGTAFPKTISVTANEAHTLNIDIDTGIR